MQDKLKRFLGDVALPKTLGSEFAYCINYQFEDYRTKNLNRSRETMFLSEEDLTICHIEDLTCAPQLYNASHIAFEKSAILRRLNQMVLRRNDNDGRHEIIDVLGITELHLTAIDLYHFCKASEALYKALMSGAIGSAIIAESKIDYDSYNNLCYLKNSNHNRDIVNHENALMLIENMTKCWLADDLQIAAAACHVRLFRPTECPMFDNTLKGGAPQSDGMIKLIDEALETFDRVDALDARETEINIVKKEGHRQINQTEDIFDRMTSLVKTNGSDQPNTCIFRQINESATFKESQFIRDLGLDVRGQVMLALWREEHKDVLEEHVAERMRYARSRLVMLRNQLMPHRNHKSVALANQDRISPLLRLWLACEQAISLSVEDIAADKVISNCKKLSENSNSIQRAISVIANTHILEPVKTVDQSVLNLKSKIPSAPKVRAANRKTVHRLFFVLRSMIVLDPDHLPKAARTVRSATTGEFVKVKTAVQAADLMGAWYSFAELAEKLPDSEDPHSGIARQAAKFRDEYHRKPDPAGIKAVIESRGAMEWRLAS